MHFLHLGSRDLTQDIPRAIIDIVVAAIVARVMIGDLAGCPSSKGKLAFLDQVRDKICGMDNFVVTAELRILAL
jgi:hypothetical protein